MPSQPTAPVPSPPSAIVPALDQLRRYGRYTWPALAAAGGLALLSFARTRFQRSQMFCPTRFPDGDWNPQSRGIAAEDVWFETEDGVRLHGWWIPNPEAKVTIVYCHGNFGSIAERVDILGEMRAFGANLFVFDYRGYGRSEGSPTTAGISIDVRTAIDHVRETRGVELDRLVLLGHSLGGAIAIEGARQRQVAGLIVQSSFTDTIDMARAFFPNVPMHLMARNQMRSVDKVPELTMPKLFLHGDADETVPYELGWRLFEAARGPKCFVKVPGGQHSDLHLRAPHVYLRSIRRFLHRCTRQGNASS
jgi:fermentation-respiration switch protein FrsA (DUF1100 family)